MANPTSMLNVLNGTETSQSLLLAAGCTLGGRNIVGAGANVVNTTATTLALTAATHANKTVVVDSAAPLAVTLPAATGTGDRYEIFINTPATATSHTVATVATGEIMSGVCWARTTSSANVIGYGTTATDNKITLQGAELGGVKGDRIVLVDVKQSTWSVQMFTSPTGTTSTPFSHF